MPLPYKETQYGDIISLKSNKKGFRILLTSCVNTNTSFAVMFPSDYSEISFLFFSFFQLFLFQKKTEKPEKTDSGDLCPTPQF